MICEEIYPTDLEIIDTNPTDTMESTFLDMQINVSNGTFHTKLYDKRRDFSFNVVSFPNLISNVPSKQSYGIFVGELFRLCKSSSKLDDFIVEVKALISKLIKQKFDKNTLYQRLGCFLKSRPACLSKYWANLNIALFV